MTDAWQDTLLHANATIRDAIQCLNDSGLQIALIVDAERTLLGTLTDGDIRRALLRSLSLDEPVATVINKSPLVAPETIHIETAINLMKANRINQLPRIDEARRVIGLFLWDKMFESNEELPNEFVIMAGGQGVRLMPHTENCPKPLLPVGDRPMMQHIIERAIADGFRNFTVSINYLGDMIVDHFGDGSRWGIKIRYVRETEPLGTGGSLGLIEQRPTRPFIVSNGDVLTGIGYSDLLNFHTTHRAKATMAIRSHEIQNAFGVVQTDGINIVRFDEKPIIRCQINAGIYVLDPDVLDHVNGTSRCDMPEIFEKVIAQKGRVIAYPMHEPWVDIGRNGDLELARRQEMQAGVPI